MAPRPAIPLSVTENHMRAVESSVAYVKHPVSVNKNHRLNFATQQDELQYKQSCGVDDLLLGAECARPGQAPGEQSDCVQNYHPSHCQQWSQGSFKGAALFKKIRRIYRQAVRMATGVLPRQARFKIYRNMVQCDATPSEKLVLKVAETKEELEACFKLLHDAYVKVGFMKPDPSGMRVTMYHALPTTTTLLAKYDGRVVGTLSLIRENTLGFPMQKIFNIKKIQLAGGNIAEISALAVHARFQAMGGIVLFPLIKMLHEYAVRFFDTRHLVIAVNPRHIGFYESILFFRRLKKNPVKNYDFVNGAPAVGAHLDLHTFEESLKKNFGKKEPSKNLYQYFFKLVMPNVIWPDKRFFTTNDPVMTPELLDYFFNQKTQVFANLSNHEKAMLHTIYDLPAYQAVLPTFSPEEESIANRTTRHHKRFSIRCPGKLVIRQSGKSFAIEIVECWSSGFKARSKVALKIADQVDGHIELGPDDRCSLSLRVVRKSSSDSSAFVFEIEKPDMNWRKFVSALSKAETHSDLDNATRYLSRYME